MKNLTYPSVTEVSDLILQRVYEKNGKIESFCWKNGICSFSFYGCRPDEIIFDKACSVSYSSKKQAFAASFQVKNEFASFYEDSFSQKEFKSLLQNVLETSGAKIQFDFSEQNSQILKFFISGSGFRQTLKSCEYCENIAFWHADSLSIIPKGNGFFITIGFEKGIVASSSLLSLFCSYSKIFYSKTFLLPFFFGFYSRRKLFAFYTKRFFNTKRKKFLAKVRIYEKTTKSIFYQLYFSSFLHVIVRKKSIQIS